MTCGGGGGGGRAVDPFLEPSGGRPNGLRGVSSVWNPITSSNGSGNSFQAVMEGHDGKRELFILAAASVFSFFPGHHGERLFCHLSLPFAS